MGRLRFPRHVSWLLGASVFIQGANLFRHLAQDAIKDFYESINRS